jgi:hypothetical protein
MTDGITNLAGIEVPSTDPTFLAVVGIHILLGLACTVTGAIAMLSQKRAGRHPRYGTIYFWCLTGLFLTATGLAVVRWAEDYHLFILGALLFAAACMGRQARRRRWRNWARLHITGMGLSYVLTNADRLLCRQWKAAAALERASSDCVLAIARVRRDTAHRPRSVVASAGATTKRALIKRAHYRPIETMDAIHEHDVASRAFVRLEEG